MRRRMSFHSPILVSRQSQNRYLLENLMYPKQVTIQRGSKSLESCLASGWVLFLPTLRRMRRKLLHSLRNIYPNVGLFRAFVTSHAQHARVDLASSIVSWWETV